jgi:3-deoxy-manno-octulosonate cytidylyltransferase (CMP-KDO synthetase)
MVATDDKRVADVVEQNGGKAVMTPPELPSGSDRVGWVVKNLDCKIVVNLQGDEPLIDTISIQNGIKMMLRETELRVITLGYPLTQEKDWMNPNIVKVLTDEFNNAMYFSRQAIPFFRNGKFFPLTCLFQHIGVYIYRKDFLLEFLNWEVPAIESAEKLEQLRILFKGEQVKLLESNSPSVGVDLPSDIEIVEKLLKERD